MKQSSYAEALSSYAEALLPEYGATTPISPAEELLLKYGITTPRDIDLEVLAYTVGARVEYHKMTNYEAVIVGVEDKAKITVDDSYGVQRARFSLSHELGHWHHHRGQRLLHCFRKDNGSANGKAKCKEREADRYAADLLMPRFMFMPRMAAFANPSFASIDELQAEFDVSREAAALRFVTLDPTPSLLICYGKAGRKWYQKSKSWPDKWIPKNDHDPVTGNMDLLFGKTSESRARTLYPASAFFNHRDADRFGVYAHSVITRSRFSQEVMTLVRPEKKSMFENEADEPALGKFLKLIEDDMKTHSGRVRALDNSLLARAEALVGDVEVDMHAPLLPEDE